MSLRPRKQKKPRFSLLSYNVCRAGPQRGCGGKAYPTGRGGPGGGVQPHLVSLPASGTNSSFNLLFVWLIVSLFRWLVGCCGTKWTGLELPQR